MDTTELTALEKKLLFNFLEQMVEYECSASTEPFELPNTVEGRTLFAAAVKHGHADQDAHKIIEYAFINSGETISIIDSILLGYLADKLGKVWKNDQKQNMDRTWNTLISNHIKLR